MKHDSKEKEWVTDCNSCGSKSIVDWKTAVEDNCTVCGSSKISIYHKKNMQDK